MVCRKGCGACCVVPSISSLGKPAFVPCPHLTAERLCGLWGKKERPSVCSSLQANLEMCGEDRAHAERYLARLEKLTTPDSH